jgi:multicomponent K+:H+ antiporter subunit D
VYMRAIAYTLVFGEAGGVAAHVAWPWLPALALGTIVLAAVGVLAARRLRALVAYLVVASAGTLLLALGLQTPATVGAGLFYLVNSTLVAAAWFLLADRVLRARAGSDAIEPASFHAGRGWLGGLFFFLAVAVAGMPPLAGFLGKSLLIQAAGQTPWAASAIAVILGASLAVMVALARTGSTVFWKPAPTHAATGLIDSPAGAAWHRAALVALVTLLAANTLGAGPLASYTQAAAAQLFERRAYIDAVLGATPVPPAYDVRREMRERGELKEPAP